MAPVLVRQIPVTTEPTSGDTELATTEAVAYCPKCKTLETLWFTGNSLMTTIKFHQQGDRVYHDCGSGEPCRLYRTLRQ